MLVAAAIAVACLLALPKGAQAYLVDTTADEPDAVLGNEICLTAEGKCSLRAALDEANASVGEFDSIEFEEGVFKGDSGSVIELGSALPPITGGLRLFGRECETEAGVTGPCVEINGIPGEPVLSIEGVEEAEFEALALTGGEVGLAAEAAPRLRVRADWFGVALDGGADGNETGILLGPGSDNGRIGGEGPGTGNLVANSSETGLEILGASGARVLGNVFGLGTSEGAAANGTDIAIASTEGGADAVGNSIGTRVSTAAAASPECDLGCNLISGADSNGIDLSGGVEGDPAIETEIVGNHFGLDRAGTGTVADSGAAILVGAAPETVIGGPRGGDANRIAGGTSAVLAGPGAPHLVIQRNLIGTQAAATGSLVPPEEGIVVDSQGLSSSEEALIVENEIGLEGGAGISQHGSGATIARNRVFGADVGIRTHGEGSENLIERNEIATSEDTGILVENSFNSIVGNEVRGAGKAGIRIQEASPESPRGNVIGGDTDAAENAIFNSGTAITIADADESLNEVARNHGSGNTGLFIDLIASGFGGSGPNHGVLPPEIVRISEAGVAGFAEPGAEVRLFRKTTTSPGEIASFLGEATADKDGNWSFTFPARLSTGSAIAATQTKEEGTSELEIATVPPAVEDTQPPAATAPAARKPPRTRVLKQPRRVRAGHVARFSFTSNEPGSSFECSLDHARFRPCRSPKEYRLSRPGKHLFRVRAIDAAGNVDPTPVRRRFEVLD